MFLILVSALFVVCPVIAITLPNGFTFVEKLYFNIEPTVNYALETCETEYNGCSNDCSTQLYCDGNYIVDPVNSYPCEPHGPYCVKNGGSMCSGNFPMSNHACLTKAINNFICSEDGQFPDPTDCTKYHICNGTAHSISECPASHQFTPDLNTEDSYTNPGNGEFRCRFRRDYESCYCDRFYWEANSFTFRSTDYFYYGYCIEIGTLRKMVMFRCPPGTRHYQSVNTVGSVDCVSIGAQPPIV